MRYYNKRPPVRHGLPLPLFEWAERRDAGKLTTAGAWLHRRRRVRAAIANAMAELAGLGERSR